MRPAPRPCGPSVEIVAAGIDDSWMRDSGPIIVDGADGRRHAVHFRFDAWGEKYAPYDRDATIGARVAAHLGLPVTRRRSCSKGGRSRSTVPGRSSRPSDACSTRTGTPNCHGRDRAGCGPGSASSRSCGSLTASPRTRRRTGTSTTSSRSRRRVAPSSRAVRTRPTRTPADRGRQPRPPRAAGIDVVEIPTLPYARRRPRCRFRTSTSTPGTESSSFRPPVPPPTPPMLATIARSTRTRAVVAAAVGAGVRWRRRALHHPTGTRMIVRTAFEVLDSPARVDPPRRPPVRIGLVQNVVESRRRRARGRARARVWRCRGPRRAAGLPAGADALALLRDHSRRSRGAGAEPEPLPGGRTTSSRRGSRRNRQSPCTPRCTNVPTTAASDTTPRSCCTRRCADRPHAQDASAGHRGLLRGQVLPRRRHRLPGSVRRGRGRRVPDVLGRMVPRGRARVRNQRRGGDRLPHRDRLRT